MSIYLLGFGMAVLCIGALAWLARREGIEQEKYELERLNREASERITKAVTDSPRDSTVLLDELRDGKRVL